jgi:hypothetical protein
LVVAWLATSTGVIAARDWPAELESHVVSMMFPGGGAVHRAVSWNR